MERFKPRDMFVEAGYGPNFADQLLQNAYSKLFEGDPIDERICFEASDDMAYIVDIGHDDIRSEGMSYGMFVTALTDHPELFEKLWRFTKRYLYNAGGPHQGFYSWQVSTLLHLQDCCGYSRTSNAWNNSLTNLWREVLSLHFQPLFNVFFI